MSEKVNDYLEEAIKNIREDRKKALSLLEDIADFIGQNQDRHKDVGTTAAKYLETLQRSNEQLVKITSMLQKSKNTEFGDLDKEETDSLYDELEDA
jgi:anion-transporting  ArsA/GET3 family ATPase